jgi:hypothetical protein
MALAPHRDGADLRPPDQPAGGCRYLRLLTNNPDEVAALESYGIRVAERVPHVFPSNGPTSFYLRAKEQRKLKIADPSRRRTLSPIHKIKHLRANSVTRPNNGILRRNNGFSASPAAEIPLIRPRSTKDQRIVNHSRSPTAGFGFACKPQEIAPRDKPAG